MTAGMAMVVIGKFIRGRYRCVVAWVEATRCLDDARTMRALAGPSASVSVHSLMDWRAAFSWELHPARLSYALGGSRRKRRRRQGARA